MVTTLYDNGNYHQYTRPNSKLPSCAGGKFIYRPAPDWLRRRRTTAIAKSESACKGGASLTGRSSCFSSKTVLTKFEMEETPNFDVLTCSQRSGLGQEQVNEIEQN